MRINKITRSSKDAVQVRTYNHMQKRTHSTPKILGTESEVTWGATTRSILRRGIAEMNERTQGRRDIRSPLEQECPFKGTVKGLLDAMAYEGKDVRWGQQEKPPFSNSHVFQQSQMVCLGGLIRKCALPVTAEAVAWGKYQQAGWLLRWRR